VPIRNYQNAVLVAQSIQQTEYAGSIACSAFTMSSAGHFRGGTLPDGTVTPVDDFGGQEKFGFSVGYMYGASAFPSSPGISPFPSVAISGHRPFAVPDAGYET
jgi:hypothetical protein